MIIKDICKNKYDPISPQAVSIYKAKVFGYAGQPCANFSGTCEIMQQLERIRAEMRENTGEDVTDVTLAEVFFPTMDATCHSEITALKVKIGSGEGAREINKDNFEDLAEYVRERMFRERTLMPTAPVKMDVSMVMPTYDATMGAATGWTAPQAPAEEQPWQYPGPMEDQPPSNDLDAMKGKGKDKGNGRGGKVIDCHRCKGLGHPMKLCPSPPNPDPNGIRCELCKGLGHHKSACPSPGGPKHVPQQKLTKGGLQQ